MRATIVLLALLALKQSANAIKMEYNVTALSSCEEQILFESTALDSIWSKRMQRFYSNPSNAYTPFNITYYVQCHNTKINQLDYNCMKIHKMLIDVTMLWFESIRFYLPINVIAMRSSDIVWRKTNYGIDVNFIGPQEIHIDYPEAFTCPFGPRTLAHATHDLVHVNMLKPYTLYENNDDYYSLWTTLLHEVGHVLGLMHNKEDKKSVMYPVSRIDEPTVPSKLDYVRIMRVYSLPIRERSRHATTTTTSTTYRPYFTNIVRPTIASTLQTTTRRYYQPPTTNTAVDETATTKIQGNLTRVISDEVVNRVVSRLQYAFNTIRI